MLKRLIGKMSAGKIFIIVVLGFFIYQTGLIMYNNWYDGQHVVATEECVYTVENIYRHGDHYYIDAVAAYDGDLEIPTRGTGGEVGDYLEVVSEDNGIMTMVVSNADYAEITEDGEMKIYWKDRDDDDDDDEPVGPFSISSKTKRYSDMRVKTYEMGQILLTFTRKFYDDGTEKYWLMSTKA